MSVGAWDNRRGETAAEYRTRLLNERDYGKLTYAPAGRTWFVFSGHRGNEMYYEKVMLSCDGAVINMLTLSYPDDERGIYGGAVERLEDNFRSGKRRC